MTRREEIIAEAKKHEYDWGIDVDRFDVPDIFAKGAEWADATVVNRACEWLKEHYAPAGFVDGIFRKAMEE